MLEPETHSKLVVRLMNEHGSKINRGDKRNADAVPIQFISWLKSVNNNLAARIVIEHLMAESREVRVVRDAYGIKYIEGDLGDKVRLMLSYGKVLGSKTGEALKCS